MKRVARIIIFAFLIFFSNNVSAANIEYSPNSTVINGEIGEQLDNLVMKEISISNLKMANEEGQIIYSFDAENQNSIVKVISSTIELYNDSGNRVEIDQKKEIISNGSKSYYYTYKPKYGVNIASYKLTITVYLYTEDYYIENYDVNIKVYENNVYEITESIDANFLIPKHGLIRKIPIDNTVSREDGSVSTNKAKVSDVRVNDKYKVYFDGNYETIRIGNPNKTVSGKMHYDIKYYYNIGKDPLEDKDEFYYNVIGTEWDGAIANVSFNIEMPKEFDSYLVGMIAGKYGSLDTGRAKYSTDGRVITGKTTGSLLEHEGLTVRVELENGYYNYKFNYELFKKQYGNKIYLLMPLIFLFIAPIIYKKHGKNDLVESIEVSPPNDKNSLEVAYIYRTYARKKDIISLLVYLANKKYLKIEETKARNGEEGFRITKLKDYSGTNEMEKTFMEGMFKNSNVVTKSSLQNSFYRTINKIYKMIDNDTYKSKVIDMKEKENSTYIFGFLIVITALFMVLPLKYVIPSYIKSSIIMFIAIIGLLALIMNYCESVKNMMSVYILGMLIAIYVCFLNETNISSFMANTAYIIYFIICQFILLYLVLFISESNKRTSEAGRALGQIKGFKTFLETVEKERLIKLVEEHPTYFYDILPYAYVLDISDKWIQKFEEIGFKEPDWYTGSKGFDFDQFDKSINETLHNSSPPPVSSSSSFHDGGSSGSDFFGSSSGGGFSSGGGGGFSGGGFSGGGSGGGGGSSW